METTMDKPKMTPKDFFMYLGTAVSLYASAGAILALLFSIIDTLLPDALNPQYVSSWATSGMRFAMSTLLVAFPLYLVLAWLIRKDIARDIAKYQLSIRKWFIYFTLFIAGATVAGDIIALVNTYLGGEISSRFIWKILSVFVVAGIIFAYYFYDLRRAESKDTKVNKTLIILAIVGVVGVVVWGLAVAGSPSQVRALRFDEQRIENLRDIQWRVTDYYQLHKALPETLENLRDDISEYQAPIDPETGTIYEYAIKGPLSFELCATFNLSNVDASAAITEPAGQSFVHDAGRVCFERTIDPQNHPVYKI